MKSIPLQLTFMLHFSSSDYTKNETINGWFRCQLIDGLSKSFEISSLYFSSTNPNSIHSLSPAIWGRTQPEKWKSISVNINILLNLKLLNVISTTYKKYIYLKLSEYYLSSPSVDHILVNSFQLNFIVIGFQAFESYLKHA